MRRPTADRRAGGRACDRARQQPAGSPPGAHPTRGGLDDRLAWALPLARLGLPVVPRRENNDPPPEREKPVMAWSRSDTRVTVMTLGRDVEADVVQQARIRAAPRRPRPARETPRLIESDSARRATCGAWSSWDWQRRASSTTLGAGGRELLDQQDAGAVGGDVISDDPLASAVAHSGTWWAPVSSSAVRNALAPA